MARDNIDILQMVLNVGWNLHRRGLLLSGGIPLVQNEIHKKYGVHVDQDTICASMMVIMTFHLNAND